MQSLVQGYFPFLLILLLFIFPSLCVLFFSFEKIREKITGNNIQMSDQDGHFHIVTCSTSYIF